MNVQGTIKDGKLVLVIDISKATRDAAQPSKSGKTRVVASTHGFTRYEDLGVSLNVTIPA